jgi:recombinational DNA repair protein (RecF pathway)
MKKALIISCKNLGENRTMATALCQDIGKSNCYLNAKLHSNITGAMGLFEMQGKPELPNITALKTYSLYESEKITTKLLLQWQQYLHFLNKNLAYNQVENTLLDAVITCTQNNNFSELSLVNLYLKTFATLGYRFDWNYCVLTKKHHERLHFLSPKSGNAVCYEAGKRYQNKLFEIPAVIYDQKKTETLPQAWRIINYFSNKWQNNIV